MKIPIIVGLLVMALSIEAPAVISLSQSSTLYTIIGGRFDFVTDQKTGIPGGDIVGGEAANHGFFTAFDDNGTPDDLTDGMIAFRVRLDDHDGTPNSPSFERVLWVGIDADLSGSIDVFVGVNRAGNTNQVVIHAPGSGSNTTPNSTGVSTGPYATYMITSYPEYMDYRMVSEDDYVGFDLLKGDTLDLGDSDTPDYYLSFMLPFGDIVNFLSSTEYNPGNTMSINEDTPLRYMLATATQDNVLNQDLGGVGADYDGEALWSDLGTFTPVMNIQGEEIPEPSIFALISVFAGLALHRRRRRH